MQAARTRCIFCSLGCECIIESEHGIPVNLEYVAEGTPGTGPLCAKGNYLLDLLNHPMRLTEPYRHGLPLSWHKALTGLARRIRRDGARHTALVLGGEASADDADIVRAWMAVCLPEGSLALHVPTGDDHVYRVLQNIAPGTARASLDDIRRSDCILAIGDPFEIGPVVAGPVLAAKHGKATITVIADTPNRTSPFATHQQFGPVRRSLAMLVRALAEGDVSTPLAKAESAIKGFPKPEPALSDIAARIRGAKRPVLVLETQDSVTARLAGLLVHAAPRLRMLAIHSYGSVPDVCDALGTYDSIESVAERVARGEVRTVIALSAEFGHDPVSAAMLTGAGYCAVATPIDTVATRHADLVLPAALWLETIGTYFDSVPGAAALPPGGARSYGDIMRGLADAMDHELPDEHETPSGAADHPVVIDAAGIDEIAGAIEAEPDAPPCRSSATRFAGGAITGHTSFAAFQATEVQ